MSGSDPTSGSASELELAIKQSVREVPDFPKPGIIFKDITPILQDSELCSAIIEQLLKEYEQDPPDVVVGIESRGFLFGLMLANALKVPFVPIRKEGKLPANTHRFSYDLEYGSSVVEMHKDALKPGQRALIHDDLLATGGTALAAAELVKMNKGEVYGFNFLIELAFLSGKKRLAAYSENTLSLATYY